MDLEIKDIGSYRDYTLDDSLYSRQRYVLGDFAMSKLSKSDVFLSGLGGIGVEISKNLILAGIKSITLHDCQLATINDLSTQFYLQPSDIGLNRAVVSSPKLSELNPYVKVHHSTLPVFDLLSNLSYLLQFKCVIFTSGIFSIKELISINEYCRLNSIYFIMVDSLGLFGWVFNDFGDNFKVYDKNGEESKEVFIADITQSKEGGIVTCMENNFHNMEDGDLVSFKEVIGMNELNDQKESFKIKIINPLSFQLSLDTSSYSSYQRGGIATQVKSIQTLVFKSLSESLEKPDFLDFDLVKSPSFLHRIRDTLQLFKSKSLENQLPKSFDREDAKQFIHLFNEINDSATDKLSDIKDEILEKISFTSRGQICPLTSVLGGFTAQEVVKSLTGKFTPLKQWLYIDAFELLPTSTTDTIDSSFITDDNNTLKSNRSHSQLISLGKDICEKLENSKLFMIGSGAIGCEMLKNYSLMGVGCGSDGKITITDNDLIEKSNLNRQFLFRNSDINLPKSKSAAKAVTIMNPSIHIDAKELKVELQSENQFSTEFYQSLDLVVSALDNVEARLYVDSKCVANCKPLLESGTLGTKGNTQIILPHLTESYSTQKDPDEKQTPFCTLKSFPTNIDHCIQWSRDKFEKLFSINILELDKFISEEDYLTKLVNNNQISNKISISKSLFKLMSSFPMDFKDCVRNSRIKFEKLFNFSVMELLKAYPLDLKTKEGLPFWSLPKRSPAPMVFNKNDELHINFIQEYSMLLANIYNISDTMSRDEIAEYCDHVVVPEFKSKNKAIISDEKAQKPVETFSMEQFLEMIKNLESSIQSFRANYSSPSQHLKVQQFEKDDDSNHHIDFITSISNIRAKIYSIQLVDRFKVKLIAGKIIPAIATTTSVVSGLVSLELIKILSKQHEKSIESYKNVYLNLALPYFSMSEPGIAPKHKVTSKFSYTLWDKWEITKPDITIGEFNQFFQTKYNLEVSGIYQDLSMVYLAQLPFYRKRLNSPLRDFLECITDQKYVDLCVSFLEENGENAQSPPIRFHL